MILPLLLLLLLHHGKSHITDAGTEDSRGLLALTDSFPHLGRDTLLLL